MDLPTIFYTIAIVLMIFWLVFLLGLIALLIVVYKKVKTAKSGLNQKITLLAENKLAKTVLMTLMLPVAKSLFSGLTRRVRK
jgi:hypothetical protein